MIDHTYGNAQNRRPAAAVLVDRPGVKGGKFPL